MLLSPCQIKYYGWKFRVEAPFGKKESNCPQSLLSSSNGFYAFGWTIDSGFGGGEYSYFVQLLRNSHTIWLKFFTWIRSFFHIFFSI